MLNIPASELKPFTFPTVVKVLFIRSVVLPFKFAAVALLPPNPATQLFALARVKPL